MKLIDDVGFLDECSSYKPTFSGVKTEYLNHGVILYDLNVKYEKF